MTFEAMLLECVGTLQPNAYGVPIFERLADFHGKSPSFGGVYTGLDNLEFAGLVTSRLQPRPHSGNYAARFWYLTDAGHRTLNDLRHRDTGEIGGLATVPVL